MSLSELTLKPERYVKSHEKLLSIKDLNVITDELIEQKFVNLLNLKRTNYVGSPLRDISVLFTNTNSYNINFILKMIFYLLVLYYHKLIHDISTTNNFFTSLITITGLPIVLCKLIPSF